MQRFASQELVDKVSVVIKKMDAAQEEYCKALEEYHKLTARFHPLYQASSLGYVYNILQDNVCKALGCTLEQLQRFGEMQSKAERLYELLTMPYTEYLQSPEWKERRALILKRDGYRCQVCNSSEHLNVHHRDYTRRGHENDTDLVTLCQGCHQVFHENSRLVRVEA